MLVITRKNTEKIRLTNGIVISIEGIDRGRVRIGIDAPRDVGISRSEPCRVCARPSFEFYLGYRDIPFCGHPLCAKQIHDNDKSLFD